MPFRATFTLYFAILLGGTVALHPGIQPVYLQLDDVESALVVCTYSLGPHLLSLLFDVLGPGVGRVDLLPCLPTAATQ